MTSEEKIDLYATLELPDKSASQSQIKHSYYKLALIHHPDKQQLSNGSKDPSIFQRISLAYQVLSDPEQRAFYDQTGLLPGQQLESEIQTWSVYFNKHPVTIEKIDQLKEEYQNSQEEKQDLIELYLSSKGNVQTILERLLFSHPDQIPRYRTIITEQIEQKDSTIPKYDRFFTWKESKRAQAKREKEAIEATKLTSTTNVNQTDLISMIEERKKKRVSIIDQLEAKYSKGRNQRKRNDKS